MWCLTVHTDKNLLVLKMKDYLIRVGKNKIDLIIQECKKPLLFVASFISVLMFGKFKALLCISKINIWHVTIQHYIICHWFELEMKGLKKLINNFQIYIWMNDLLLYCILNSYQ